MSEREGEGVNVTLAGVMAPQFRPAGIVSVRDTAPAKPFSAVTVMVKAAVESTIALAGEVAAMLKSSKVKVDVVE